ncbi:hypothetical protein [Pararobbsia silviterrae]|uniref:Cation transporter n=1 Tax=Pararobbsia silviterrae TaxID=1792498 RepID=A0A494XZ74_9BURK|nr:hypothetical protein [Pararobbsia silviterrae]RKP53389.1 hypothetical protein D7S86_16895 [Pararobbsia silviterrae]
MTSSKSSSAAYAASHAASEATHVAIADLFPGSRLSHILHVVTEPSVSAVSSVIECIDSLKSLSLDIESVHVRRLPTAFDQRVCLHGIDETHARAIRDRLETLAPVIRVKLEHQIKVSRDDA